MRVRLLGTAAGGGFPQWNCACSICRAARTGRAAPRTQFGVALSADERCWFLIGASPDLSAQIETFAPLRSEGRVRGSAIEGVLLTGADLDHVLGLLLLREGDRLHVHATRSVRRALTEGLALDSVLSRYCGVEWLEPPERLEPLNDRDGRPSGLLYEAFPVPGKPPRYREGRAAPDPGDCIGYRIVDERTGGRLVVVPGAAAIDAALARRLAECDALLIDGTFWSESEMRDAGVGSALASEMGHIPVGGPRGSLCLVSRLAANKIIYVHINNTNPILLDESAQRQEVTGAGVEVGRDGLEVTL